MGLTGGIGSGKSTVAAALRELGAVLVDADTVAREVMQPGTATLARVAERFGSHLIEADGSLDRAALAALVFPDAQALAALDAITTPAISERVRELRDQAPTGAVSVFDMPLLVERRLWPKEHLTVVVGADEEVRVGRLVDQRGMDDGDVRHRIAAQATDDQRRAAADVWIDNTGTFDETIAQVRRLWEERLTPYQANLQSGTRTKRPDEAAVVPPDPTWSAQGARLVAKLQDTLGDRAVSVDHIGSTSVPALIAKDVIDLQVGVRRLPDADDPRFVGDLRERGFLRVHEVLQDHPHPGSADPAGWQKRFHASLDPGRVANVHIREIGSAGWIFALQFRDWLRSVPSAKQDYAAEKRRLLSRTYATEEYAAAKEPWFDQAYARVQEWAGS